MLNRKCENLHLYEHAQVMFLMLFEEDKACWNHFLMVKTGNHMFRTVYYFARERCCGRDAVQGVSDPFDAQNQYYNIGLCMLNIGYFNVI